MKVSVSIMRKFRLMQISETNNNCYLSFSPSLLIDFRTLEGWYYSYTFDIRNLRE